MPLDNRNRTPNLYAWQKMWNFFLYQIYSKRGAIIMPESFIGLFEEIFVVHDGKKGLFSPSNKQNVNMPWQIRFHQPTSSWRRGNPPHHKATRSNISMMRGFLAQNMVSRKIHILKRFLKPMTGSLEWIRNNL